MTSREIARIRAIRDLYRLSGILPVEACAEAIRAIRRSYLAGDDVDLGRVSGLVAWQISQIEDAEDAYRRALDAHCVLAVGR